MCTVSQNTRCQYSRSSYSKTADDIIKLQLAEKRRKTRHRVSLAEYRMRRSRNTVATCLPLLCNEYLIISIHTMLRCISFRGGQISSRKRFN